MIIDFYISLSDQNIINLFTILSPGDLCMYQTVSCAELGKPGKPLLMLELLIFL